MDDDLDFGASVWGLPSDPISLSSVPQTLAPAVPDDTFDDFAGPVESSPAEGDDDFGDFGEFSDVKDAGDAAAFGEEAPFDEDVRIPAPAAANWEPLRLHPMPSRSDLRKQVDAMLGPIWESLGISDEVQGEEYKEGEGINKILVTQGSRDLYQMLTAPPPPLTPPNWTRSHIRRQHLIALGVPVNLDEVLPKVAGKLPPLQVSTRPMSAPPGSRPQTNPRESAPRNGTPQPSGSRAGPAMSQLGLGPKPTLDEAKISELLDLGADQLPLLPLSALEGHLSALRTQTAHTASLLTHLLQTRDALQQDSETYNALIAELVGEAQKIKTGKGRPTSKR